MPGDEHDTWIDENGIDLIETGGFRNPELCSTYLAETVFLQLGREAIERAAGDTRVVTAYP